MKVDTSFNLLASYAYMRSNGKFNSLITSKAKNKELNLMIDSGAFTAHNAKQKRDFINVDDYCKFLEMFGECAEKYVMLDVVMNEAKSKSNYEIMVKRGFKPMFVATQFDNDFSYIEDTLKVNPNICVAGGVTQPMNWCIARYQNVYYKTGNKAKIHGLGYVKFPTFLQLPLASGDSSTWSVGAQKFGTARIWHPSLGLKTAVWTDYLKTNRKIPLYMQEQMNEVKITPAVYSMEKNHKGSNSLDYFLSIIAYVKYQKYAKRCGKDLFLAVSIEEHVNRISYVYENFHNLDYEKYVKHFSE